MASNKIEMSLEDIIKKDRKNGPQRGKKGGGVAHKGKPAKTTNIRKNQKKNPAGGPKPINSVATKRLVQKLVKKALAQNSGRKNGNQPRRGVRKTTGNASTPRRGVSNRSQVIKKTPRTETVIVRKIVKPRPQPRQQIVREVIVQEPIRQRVISQPPRRFNNRPKIIYVEKRGPPRSFSGNGFQRQRFVQRRRNNDPFYEPANYLQRI